MPAFCSIAGPAADPDLTTLTCRDQVFYPAPSATRFKFEAFYRNGCAVAGFPLPNTAFTWVLNVGNTGMEALPVSAEAVERLIAGVRDAKPVSGLTHNFYRYPARFSPTFARAFIAECTEPGELVLDPFVGGGTTIVEAQAMGRRATGVDLSSLPVFVSTVKTTPLPEPITADFKDGSLP